MPIKTIILNLLSNMKYLSKQRLNREIAKCNLDYTQYILKDRLPNLRVPRIFTIEQTLDYLLTNEVSLARFGDGELELLEGRNIGFQKASPLLSEKLRIVLANNSANLLIGIPFVLFHDWPFLTLHENFWALNGKRLRSYFWPYYLPEKQYACTEVTLVATYLQNYDFKAYFDEIRRLWDQKEICLVIGKGLLDDLQYNIFDNAKQIYFIDVPRQNAFEEYEHIVEAIKKYSQHLLFVGICGPTATVLAYDATLLGYRFLDMGHIAKAYDWYMKGTNFVSSNLQHFFAPD